MKTNALSLAATVANIGVEIQIDPKFSIDLPVYFSPYNLSSTKKLRILAVQPEFRYWIARNGMQGHFVGAHTQLAYFNVSWTGRKRYQDNSPVLGGGISYGYTLPLSCHWDVEFNLGAGYAHLAYDIYENAANGQKIGTGVRNYWGITRAGISFSYKLR